MAAVAPEPWRTPKILPYAIAWKMTGGRRHWRRSTPKNWLLSEDRDLDAQPRECPAVAGHGPGQSHPLRQATPQEARRATVTGNRAARIAGSRPPAKPMIMDMSRPRKTSSGVTLKLNTTCVKF